MNSKISKIITYIFITTCMLAYIKLLFDGNELAVTSFVTVILTPLVKKYIKL